ncbi:H/ACA ribonucleoprotein complex subunit GAR1 [Haloarcula onubensis]|uniref:Gar1/Naf1 family protein n=1 Tax=Haloarcula onubensis TaxID=2950539 RepID=A0ABU2FMK3_9EURY|nr:Gar1/Naf1 family protein [Halomicroarcula sp. S3CR25-11]MDS0281522.1 Gar1/Naf1 family protein [Halomicroarcula sp. S3CR25-11]
MRRVGSVERLAQGLAVVRATDEGYADIGSTLVDEELTSVGEVVDVFGPVERPYMAVSPASGVHIPALLGSPLYAR